MIKNSEPLVRKLQKLGFTERSYPPETPWPVIAHLLTGAISSVEAWDCAHYFIWIRRLIKMCKILITLLNPSGVLTSCRIFPYVPHTAIVVSPLAGWFGCFSTRQLAVEQYLWCLKCIKTNPERAFIEYTLCWFTPPPRLEIVLTIFLNQTPDGWEKWIVW